MKKTFEYDLTKYSPDAPTRTEEFITADGVKTLTTDANDGAVLIQDSVDKDSLNPVTAAAVSAAIEAGGGGGSGVEYVTRSNTFEEVLAVYQAGKLPVLEYEIGGKKYFYVMTRYGANDGHYLYKGVFLFTQWTGSSSDAYTHVLAGQLGVGMYTCYRDGNGATQWSSATSYILPSYGSGNAGQVLQVQNDGTLAWVTLT